MHDQVKKMSDILIPKDYEVMSPEEYLRISQEEIENIESVHFIPPEIGKGGFGAFAVTYRTPVLRAL